MVVGVDTRLVHTERALQAPAEAHTCLTVEVGFHTGRDSARARGAAEASTDGDVSENIDTPHPNGQFCRVLEEWLRVGRAEAGATGGEGGGGGQLAAMLYFG